LEKGAKISIVGTNKRTAFHLVARKGSKEAISFLLKHGLVINAQTADGYTPLHLAVLAGNVETVEALLANKADPNIGSKLGWLALHSAVYDEQKDIAALLLENGANPNLNEAGVLRGGHKGTSALHLAAASRNRELVDLSLDYKANVDILNSKDDTPLHIAAAHLSYSDQRHFKRTPTEAGSMLVAKILLANKANLRIKDKNGRTPLTVAVASKWNELADLLRRHGAKE